MLNNVSNRIAFLVGDISRGGGTERVTCDVANLLLVRGWQVSIISMSAGLCSTFSLAGEINLYTLKCEDLSSTFGVKAARRRLRAVAQKLQIDWMIDVDPLLSYYSIPALEGLKIENIAWEHFNLFANPGDLIQKWRRLRGRLIASRRARALIVLSDRDLAQYRFWLKPRCLLKRIYNPSTSSIRFLSADAANRRHSRIVLAVGRLEKQKGFDLLLQAWAKIQPCCPGWTLRIVGSGSQELKLTTLVKKLGLKASIQFVPFTGRIEDHYREASFFVCSSRFEGFGLVLTEAKRMGLPVVSFDCPCGPSEIVRSGIDGLLVRKADCQQLSEALCQLMDDELMRLSFANHALADDRFHGDDIASKWSCLLESLQSSPQG